MERTTMGSEPRATYRLQLHAAFDFDAAAAVADYLARLGVSHLYCSPYLQAAPGSTHGYDVVDPTSINAELGGPTAHARLVGALGQLGLGQILDIVPNHMAIGVPQANAWWWDVLRHGPGSRFASYFAVDWEPPLAERGEAVILPILGDHYGRVLEAGGLRLMRPAGAVELHYGEHRLPIALPSLAPLLALAAARAGDDELTFWADTLAALGETAADGVGSLLRRQRDLAVIEAALVQLLAARPHVAASVDAGLAEANADPDALDAVLQRQHYRLAHWRAAAQELDYRRFFDVTSLIGLRVEDEAIFAATHALVLGWLRGGLVHGVRVDHPDGLRDPEGYVRRLHEAAPQAWVVVEKILKPGEALPETWPVAGTTGYDFLNCVGGLFVDPAGEGPLTALYAEFTGAETSWPVVVLAKKELTVRRILAADFNRLAVLFRAVCQGRRRYRDYTQPDLHAVLRAVAVQLPIYRTYVRAEAGVVAPADGAAIEAAIAAARAARPELDPELFDFWRDLLLLRIRGALETELVMRFQQLTGPVMAKGVEDTAFYTYNRLISLNEVGGDPGQFGTSLADFHAAMVATQQRWPRTMLATATHDHKRGEDTRLRISLLSEIPARWAATVREWSALAARHRQGEWPDRNTEYLFYQTLVGTWPLGVERAQRYLEKATREAKVHTAWTDPNADYERAIQAFVAGVLADADFTAAVTAFVRTLERPAWISSLAQTLIKLTAPGVPDIYQGTELWDHSLVDPDNRRPVDYERRRALLAALEDATPEALWARAAEGLPKLAVVRTALAVRAERPDAFGAAGVYRPLLARGAQAAHAVAYGRGDTVVVVVPRLVIGLGDDWADTALDLPAGRWRERLTDAPQAGTVALAALLARFPVALLTREEEA